jgi:hypothetical protein
LLHRDCLYVTNYLFLNIILIVKRHIFYDTCVMNLIYDEIEKTKWKKYF